MEGEVGEVAGLIATLRGHCFRLLAACLRQEHEGLAVAARAAKRNKVISRKTCRRLERIDDAYAVSRHISGVRVKNFCEKLRLELNGSGAVQQAVCGEITEDEEAALHLAAAHRELFGGSDENEGGDAK